MDKANVSKFFSGIKTYTVKHAPEILTGIGVAGMIATTVMAVRATPKALKLIEAKKKEEHVDHLNAVETVKTTWKCYIPATVTGITSAACLVGASSVNARRNAALATAYSLSKSALTEYKDKVVETIGEKKEKDIRDKIAKDRIERDPVENHEIVNTERGSTLCYDSLFGRYFISDRDTILNAMHKINHRMIGGSEMYVSLNEFYNEIGLGPVDMGYDLGWKIDDGPIEIDFSSMLSSDGRPALVLNYNLAPKYGYDKYL